MLQWDDVPEIGPAMRIHLAQRHYPAGAAEDRGDKKIDVKMFRCEWLLYDTAKSLLEDRDCVYA